MKEIVMCERNQRDVQQINPAYIKNMKFHFVKTMDEVVELSLQKNRFKGAADFSAFLKDEKPKP